MVDPAHPQYVRIFVSDYVDHLAKPAHLNIAPICGRGSLNSWSEYDAYTPAIPPNVRLCRRCEALAGDA